MRSELINSLGSLSWIRKPVAFLALISFSIFLNHLLVIDTLSKFYGINPDSPSMPNLMGYLIISIFLALIITIPLAWAIQKIPILRKIVGIN